jgi:hypothetical protein
MQRMDYYRYCLPSHTKQPSIWVLDASHFISSSTLDLILRLLDTHFTKNDISSLDSELQQSLLKLISTVIKSEESEGPSSAGIDFYLNWVSVVVVILAKFGKENETTVLSLLTKDPELLKAILTILLQEEDSSVQVGRSTVESYIWRKPSGSCLTWLLAIWFAQRKILSIYSPNCLIIWEKIIKISS